MAYQLLTNVANMDTLLGYIRDFLDATGDWTIVQDMVTPDEDGPTSTPEQIANLAHGSQLVVSNGDCLAGLRSTTGGLGKDRLYLFDGIAPYSSGTLDSMNGNSGNRYDGNGIVAANLFMRGFQAHAGPFPKAHLFTNDPSTYCHIVVEVSAGVFKHMMFGNLIKFGTWTGGGYYCGHWWDTSDTYIDEPTGQHSVPFDNYGTLGNSVSWTVHYENGSDKWISAQETGSHNGVVRNRGRSAMRGGFGRIFRNIKESSFSGLIPLGPILVQAVRLTDDPDTTRFIGQAPDVRAVNMTNLAPGATITIGSDTWMCFPMVAKNGAVNQYNSKVTGYAYKLIS